jgi:hypothetical protein
VAGRILLGLAGTTRPGRGLAVTALAGMGGAAALLAGVPVLPGLVVAFALVHGACYGAMSILRPVVIRETLGSDRFGATQGAIVRPALIAFAAAPLLAALLAERLGYGAVVALCVAAQGAGALLLARLPRGG